jgi:hypothetical protein
VRHCSATMLTRPAATCCPQRVPPAEDALVAKLVRAYEPGDVDALVEQLVDDVLMSMPPMSFEYEGRLPGSVHEIARPQGARRAPDTRRSNPQGTRHTVRRTASGC